MFNSNLFTVRNVAIIAVFAIIWQLIFTRVNAYLHTTDAPARAEAQ